MENIEIVRKDVSRILKALDPYKAFGPIQISPYMSQERPETLDKLLKMFRNWMEEESVPS